MEFIPHGCHDIGVIRPEHPHFASDDFLNGTATELPFNHESQKESICFKNDSTLYITDEKSHGGGGNLYEFDLGKR